MSWFPDDFTPVGLAMLAAQTNKPIIQAACEKIKTDACEIAAAYETKFTFSLKDVEGQGARRIILSELLHKFNDRLYYFREESKSFVLLENFNMYLPVLYKIDPLFDIK
ncbi:MAG: hypothetical protein P4L69_13495 [Desulfosporosinus sp.]|nr:hypothetical protein [Desulfosporosinus sp.]